MAISTYKASSRAIGVKGTHQFTGKTSCTNSQYLDHAKNVARTRAKQKLDSYLRSLQAEGKVWKNAEATGICRVNGCSVTYEIAVKFE